MHRFVVILPLLLAAACSGGEKESAETWAKGRDGLCLAGSAGQLRAGLVTYGEDNANCSIAGPAARTGDRLTITPTGDARCTVEVDLSGDAAVIGARTPACGYYCGPGADYSGRSLAPTDRPTSSVTDFAGDPLC